MKILCDFVFLSVVQIIPTSDPKNSAWVVSFGLFPRSQNLVGCDGVA